VLPGQGWRRIEEAACHLVGRSPLGSFQRPGSRGVDTTAHCLAEGVADLPRDPGLRRDWAIGRNAGIRRDLGGPRGGIESSLALRRPPDSCPGAVERLVPRIGGPPPNRPRSLRLAGNLGTPRSRLPNLVEGGTRGRRRLRGGRGALGRDLGTGRWCRRAPGMAVDGGRWRRTGVLPRRAFRTLGSDDRLGTEPASGCGRRLTERRLRPLGLRPTVASALVALPGPLLARRRSPGATQRIFASSCRGRCGAWLVRSLLGHRRRATRLRLLGDRSRRSLALATLNRRFSVGPGLGTRIWSGRRRRRHVWPRILPAPNLGTRSDLRGRGRRVRFPSVRSTLDLDLRFNLGLRPWGILFPKVGCAPGSRVLGGPRLPLLLRWPARAIRDARS
jgi:hypothetical protein